MGTYENFYLNQIKQLQEENNKLKQIIDEGILSGNIVSAAVRGLEQQGQRDIEKDKRMLDRIKRRFSGNPSPGYGTPSDRPAPVVPGRSDPEGYASDDMESRRTQPGYGPSSDSQGRDRAEVLERLKRRLRDKPIKFTLPGNPGGSPVPYPGRIDFDFDPEPAPVVPMELKRTSLGSPAPVYPIRFGGFSPKLPHRERVRRARERGVDVDSYRY